MYMSVFRHSHTSEHVFLTNITAKGISADADQQVGKKSKTQLPKEWQEQDCEQNQSSFWAVCAEKGLELRKEKFASVTGVQIYS